MLYISSPFVDRIQPQSNKFATGEFYCKTTHRLTLTFLAQYPERYCESFCCETFWGGTPVWGTDSAFLPLKDITNCLNVLSIRELTPFTPPPPWVVSYAGFQRKCLLFTLASATNVFALTMSSVVTPRILMVIKAALVILSLKYITFVSNNLQPEFVFFYSCALLSIWTCKVLLSSYEFVKFLHNLWARM